VTVVNRWTDPAWAQRYLADRDEIPHRAEGVAVLMEFLPADPERVLDLGTGDGYTLDLVRRARPAVEGVGVDFSAEMLERARARFAEDPRVRVVDHDLDEPLPSSLGRFDLVVSSFAIHHCVHERKRALYGEVFERLEPGGMFINLEHVDSATLALHLEFLAAVRVTPAEDEEEHGTYGGGDDPSNKLLDVETQLRWLREIGFDDVDCHWKWRELALFAGVKPTA
jgi:tRNA (cmo5U34)-methyltransferase